MILFSKCFVKSSESIAIKPASTISCAPQSSISAIRAFSQSALLSKSFLRSVTPVTLWFFALSRAYAPVTLEITFSTFAFVILPLSTASRIACRFVPPPETRTATFNIIPHPFRRLRFCLQHKHLRLQLSALQEQFPLRLVKR